MPVKKRKYLKILVYKERMLVGEFESVQAAADALGLQAKSIYKVMPQGRRLSCYMFRGVEADKPLPEQTARICLRCEKPFDSASPYNRICGGCNLKNTQERSSVKSHRASVDALNQLEIYNKQTF